MYRFGMECRAACTSDTSMKSKRVAPFYVQIRDGAACISVTSMMTFKRVAPFYVQIRDGM